MTPEQLKAKGRITREDVSKLLSSIGKPGQKRDQKLKAIQKLELKNNQGHDIDVTLDSYEAW